MVQARVTSELKARIDAVRKGRVHPAEKTEAWVVIWCLMRALPELEKEK